MQAVMLRMGEAMRLFHDHTSSPAEFDGRILREKLVRYAHALTTVVADTSILPHVLEVADRVASVRRPMHVACTLKGIDIRNLLLTDDDCVFLLDPGKRKLTWPEADVARFLTTFRILWWGSPAFLFGLRPDAAAETAFLNAYDESGQHVVLLRRAQMIKELLKHWHTARDSLRLKPWPALAKRAVARSWIDPFYAGQLRAEIAGFL